MSCTSQRRSLVPDGVFVPREGGVLLSVHYFFPLATITLPHRVDVLTALTSSSP